MGDDHGPIKPSAVTRRDLKTNGTAGGIGIYFFVTRGPSMGTHT